MQLQGLFLWIQILYSYSTVTLVWIYTTWNNRPFREQFIYNTNEPTVWTVPERLVRAETDRQFTDYQKLEEKPGKVKQINTKQIKKMIPDKRNLAQLCSISYPYRGFLLKCGQ